MKKLFSVILVIAMLFSFAGCSAAYEQNAMELVTSNLNIVYHGECTEKYASVAGMTVEEAEAFYEDGLISNAQLFMEGVQIEYPTEEITERYTEIFRKIFRKFDFSILGAEQKDENTVIVTLEVYPVDIAEDWATNLETEMAILDLQYADVDFSTISDEDYIAYDHAWAEAIARSFENAIFSAKTGETVTIEAEVVYDEGMDVWQITDKSMEEIDVSAFIVE